MANHEKRLHNFGSKWTQVVLSTKWEKVIFLENSPILQCLTIAPHHPKMFLKNSRAVNDIQAYVILGQIAPILRQKEIFSENDKDYSFLSLVPHRVTKLQRDRQKMNHEKGCIILAQIALIAIAQKGIFLVN